jgi:endogenous inhibitor of DNA gyrase (YacG/DUF329 family)
MSYIALDRCPHCGKIPKVGWRVRNALHYQPYCSFKCQEDAKLRRQLLDVQRIRSEIKERDEGAPQ